MNHPHHHHDASGAAGAGDSSIAFDNSRDTEWGSKQIIQPSWTAGLIGPVAAPGLGKPMRLINLQGKARNTRMISAAVCASGVLASNGGFRGSGPIVAIANFSGGGGGGIIEFDVPCNAGFASWGVSQGGGGIVCMPASSLDLQVRNDGGFIPQLGLAGATPIGDPEPIPAFCPTISAHVGMGPKTGRLTRSVFMVSGTAPGFSGAQLATRQLLRTPVPPFARSFHLLRVQSVPADVINISLLNGGGLPLDVFTLAGTAGPSPEYIVGPAAMVDIEFPLANAGGLTTAVLVFSIENGGG